MIICTNTIARTSLAKQPSNLHKKTTTNRIQTTINGKQTTHIWQQSLDLFACMPPKLCHVSQTELVPSSMVDPLPWYSRGRQLCSLLPWTEAPPTNVLTRICLFFVFFPGNPPAFFRLARRLAGFQFADPDYVPWGYITQRSTSSPASVDLSRRAGLASVIASKSEPLNKNICT